MNEPGSTRSASSVDVDRHAPGWFGAVAVAAALSSALATFLILSGLTPVLPTHDVVVWAFRLNIVLVLVLAGTVVWEARGIVRARMARAAAAGLHIRIVGLFSLVATFPAILVAIVAMVTLERGLDPWFTGWIRELMQRTGQIAQSYRELQCRTMVRETNLMAADLNRAKVLFDADRKVFVDFMASRATFLGFPVAMIVEPNGSVVERIDLRPIEGLKPPGADDIDDVSEKDAFCFVPREGNVFRAAVRLAAHGGRVLFVARAVDKEAVEFPAQAAEGIAIYEALEKKSLGTQVAFASMFALVSLIVLFSAVWFGLRFANRFVTPIRRLIYATGQVAQGNFYVQVPVRRPEGDLARLGETFNSMTSELRRQHDSLLTTSDLMDRRRRFTEAVLAGVSAGVIGVDGRDVITIANPSAETLLDLERQDLVGRSAAEVLPEIAGLLEEARGSRQRLLQQQIQMTRKGRERTVNVRVTSEQARGEDKGLVVTLDDITDLVSAQRTSAWADVARRIAHEIKNPLTPIQLSAERIRRKYGKVITTDREVFDQCTATIVRQVDDIKRMVDEFSSFARMPKPTMGEEDLSEIVRQVVFMMRIAHPEIRFDDDGAAIPVRARFDRRLVSQAVTNIVKNATEGIAALPESERGEPVIRVSVSDDAGRLAIDIVDTGKGFPAEGRQRLLEPYMTTRDGGTGLGLPIVGKVFEEHGGGIELLDNPGGRGAWVRLWFPRAAQTNSNEEAAPAAAGRRLAIS
nr:PAS domain-containing sensor histidine kinase [Salinarimonas soli]